MQECIRVDLLKLLRLLTKRREGYRLSDLEDLAGDIKHYYHAHKRNLITEEHELIKQKLQGLVSRLRRLNRLYFDDRDGEWVRVYSFNPKDEATIDRCTVRFYLNPKFEYLWIIYQIARFGVELPPSQRAPFMFKFPHPKNPLERYLRGPEKVILYACSQPRFIRLLEAKLKSFPDDYFFDAIPLFTHKVRRGVGMTYDPKEENGMVKFLRRLKKTDDIYISYGQYISYW